MSKSNSNSYFPLLLALFTAIAYLIGLFNSDFTSNNNAINTNKISHLINVIENKDDYLTKKKNMKNFSYQNTWNNINQKIITTINEN